MEQQEIWITGDTLFYKNYQSIEKANLNSLKYAYVQILGDVPYLFLFADYQHYISTALFGFDAVYRALSDRFPFDNDTFFAVCKTRKEGDKVKIWSKKMVQNYQIVHDQVQDAEQGYEVLTTPKQMISWDITYEELEATDFVEAYFSDYGAKYLRFKFPVRIEHLIINYLEIYADNIIANRPVKEYFVDLYDSTNTDQSYKDLRQLWIDESVDVDEYGYEREDQCYLRFECCDGIDASISYTYDTDYGYDDGSTSLHFYNNRTYTHFLNNEDYEAVMEISEYISFGKSLELNIHYIDHANIKHVPAGVKEVLKNKSGVWIDHPNGKIGFAGTDTALILDFSQFTYFELQNVLPAKGAGYASFALRLPTDDYLYIFSEDTFFFNQFSEQLRRLTNKKVEIPTPDYNC